MTHSLDAVVWSAESLGDALLALAKFAKLPHQTVRLAIPAFSDAAHWLDAAADRIGLECEAVESSYADVESLLHRAAPALIAIRNPKRERGRTLPSAPDAQSAEASSEAKVDEALALADASGYERESLADASGYLVVLGPSRRHLRVVAPDLSVRRVAIAEVREAMCRQVEAPHRQPIEQLLKEVGLTGRAAKQAGEALLAKRLADQQVGGCWMLRAPGRGEIRWGYWLTVMIGTHVIEQACSLSAWTLLGWMTFSGRLDGGWLLAWIMLLVCVIPFRVFSLAAGGRLSLEFSLWLRRRLLAGALRLDPDRVRVEGTGGLLGRVMEAETLEQLALGGGMQSVLSVVELAMAMSVLGSATSQWGGAALLGTFVALAVWLTAINARRREAWTDARLGLTNDLVERMVGHRTTLAQEPREQAATETDQALERYLDPSTKLDRSSVVMQSLIPRAWLLCGLIWLAPAFVNGGASVTVLAVSLGGLLLAKQGLQRLVEGLDRIAGAAVAWRRLKPFLAKPDHPEPIGDPDLVASPSNPKRERGRTLQPAPAPHISSNDTATRAAPIEPAQTTPSERSPSLTLRVTKVEDDIVLDTRDVTFRHANRSEPVLRGVDLTIRRNDRVLLEGPSGGGKSTLATLLSGARTPQAGVLLLGGLDRQTLGRAWRRRIVLAPQFHHNHVLMGTFLFNLLLGRTWPPSKSDAEEAERLCRQLDLGPLIDRMPGGLLQMVGETGWQLSHGEKSRLFLARALLQRADVVLLDETFSALDPETLSRLLPKVLELAPSLVVIAHP